MECPLREGGQKIQCLKCGQRLQIPVPNRRETVLGSLIASSEPPAAEPSLQVGPPPVPRAQAKAKRRRADVDKVLSACPSCGQRHKLHPDDLGDDVECLDCGLWFQANEWRRRSLFSTSLVFGNLSVVGGVLSLLGSLVMDISVSSSSGFGPPRVHNVGSCSSR
jgi:hypothetical protein